LLLVHPEVLILTPVVVKKKVSKGRVVEMEQAVLVLWDV
jgi:hypothetical protein